MREWCGCGAAIRARRSDVLKWRNNHNHPGESAPDDPERNGSHAHIEHAGPRYFEHESAWGPDAPIVNARTRTGFH